MLISQAFPSEFLKASDLQNKTVRAVMQHVEMREVGDDIKPVLFFRGKTKGLVLNKTNANNIAIIYGDETDEWMGQELLLYPTMVDYQGRSVDAIRVRAPRPNERHLAPVHTAAPLARQPMMSAVVDDFEVVEDGPPLTSAPRSSSLPLNHRLAPTPIQIPQPVSGNEFNDEAPF